MAPAKKESRAERPKCHPPPCKMMMMHRCRFVLPILFLSLIEGAGSINWFGVFREAEDSDCPSPTTTSEPETTPAPTTTPAPVPPPTGQQSPIPAPTSTPTINNDRFTILVMSDMENKWRGHSIDRSRYVVQYIKNVKGLNLFFDDEYSHYPIDPQLVINTGDVTHYWACHNPNYIYSRIFGGDACRQPDDEFHDIWQQLYDAGIPMISTYGNHDWKPRIGTGNPYRGTPTRPRDTETDKINRWSSEFVSKTYQKAAAMTTTTTTMANGSSSSETIQRLDYEEIPPTGSIGQSMYRATFRGLQLASFNAAYNWQSYNDEESGGNTIFSADDQFLRLANTLDRSKPTLFFSHFPLSATRLDGQTPTRDEVIDLIQQFPFGSHHFAGHYHAASVQSYPGGFNDYIVPYPHTWGNRQPGFLAVLVSPQEGILSVKPLTIPGLEDGTSCVQITPPPVLPVSPQRLRQRLENLLGYHDRREELDNGCDRCKAGKQYWSPNAGGSGGWFCGDEPNSNPILTWEDEELPLDSLDYSDLVEEGED